MFTTDNPSSLSDIMAVHHGQSEKGFPMDGTFRNELMALQGAHSARLLTVELLRAANIEYEEGVVKGVRPGLVASDKRV